MSFEFLLDLFIQYGYWIIFAGILLDNAGFPLPGELLLLTFGALARTGHVSLELGILLASAAAVSGDSIGYWLGRRRGQGLLRAYCRLTLGSGKCLARAVAFYRLRGSVAVVFGRFVMGVRAFLAPLAGSARMPYGRFLLFDVVGAVLWASLFSVVGYSVGWRAELIGERYRTVSAALAAFLAAGLAVYFVIKLVRRRRHGAGWLRERMVARVAASLGSYREPESGASIPIAPVAVVRGGDDQEGQDSNRSEVAPPGGGGRSGGAQSMRPNPNAAR